MAPAPPRTGSNLLDEIAQAIGAEAAIALAHSFGGQRLYVPRQFAATDPVVLAIGAEKAALLSEHYHLTRLVIPAKLRRRAIVRTLYAQTPRPRIADIAKLAGIAERTVYDILAEPESAGTRASRAIDVRQIDLFDR